MTLRGWGVLLSVMTLVGMARVGQATALRMRAYAVGQQERRVHRLENDTAWLRTRVMTLESPGHLVQVMSQRKWDLVARSELSSAPASMQLAQSRAEALSPAGAIDRPGPDD